MRQSSPIFVPPFQNILQFTVDFIFEEYTDLAPDFSDLFVLLPHAQAAQQFNNLLCHSTDPDAINPDSTNSGSTNANPGNKTFPAIIPPWVGTLKTWLNQFSRNKHADYSIISEYSRQLLFIEALQQHPDLFKAENQWQVTQALLKLFDELSLNQVNIFGSETELLQQLENAYGIEQQHREIQHLHNESKIVYTLWHAWQQQLDENNFYDESSDYLSRLQQATKAFSKEANKDQQFICLSLSYYSKAEQSFIQQLINNEQCRIIEYDSTLNITDAESSIEPDSAADLRVNGLHTNDLLTYIIESFRQPSCSDELLPIKQRAEAYADNHPDLASEKAPFSLYLASNEEQQIRAIDYFVRLKLLDGKNNIGIISEDRKLSRRLRALLERSNVPLQDNAGWSLATTQAATVIERWLECIEEDFSAYPLLDCLKSPFLDITLPVLGEDATDEDFKKNIYRFEHDLIFHENVSSNINHYKSQLKNRLGRLSHWPQNSYDDLISTLDFIQRCATPLKQYYIDSTQKNHTEPTTIRLADFLDALCNSLQQLGIFQSYQNDDAGLTLLKTFEELKQSVLYSNPFLSWHDCRTWLGIAIESKNFSPATDDTGVKLMTLEQSSHQTFDCLIIAATESQHYPGSANNSPFFNQAVRASLGLPIWEQQCAQRHENFNRALLSAPDVLLTACNEEKGEEKPVSPWLELLINFYNLAFENSADFKTLDDIQLMQLVQSNHEVHCAIDDVDDDAAGAEWPELSRQPSPVLHPELQGKKFSASSYQRLINCPYQHFSADGLHLKPLEELSDELKKSNYGERIHTILQTFHCGHKKFGKAFSQTISDSNRIAAEGHLLKLSKKIFLSDMEDNVLHRSWFFRWEKHIPAYIDWQIQNQNDWNIYLSEEHLETTLSESNTLPDSTTIEDNTVTVYGRLDRIDRSRSDESHAIIDYKTGSCARQDDVDSGENVQLSLYALLDELASSVSYLSVDSSAQKVETKSYLAGNDLQDNREKNKHRLIELSRQIEDAEPLTAWGDNTVCQYCNFSGLCRKASWEENQF